MSIEPSDTKGFLELVAATKATWQYWLSVFGGALYGAWKYIDTSFKKSKQEANERFEKAEAKTDKILGLLVTQTQMDKHTAEEDKKFEELLRHHEQTNVLLQELRADIAALLERVEYIKSRQVINEEQIDQLERDVAAIKERHHMEDR